MLYLLWFKSYLENRQFSVHINGTNSSIEIVLCGVPQESILGPILFILHRKELHKIVSEYNINLQFYADDSTLYFKLNPKNCVEIETSKDNIQRCIKEVKKWMTVDFPVNMTLNLSGKVIKSLDLQTPGSKDSGKSLGILLSNDLSLKRQISSVKQSCYNNLRNLKNIKEFLSTDTKLILVKCLVLSKLDFCNSLYYNMPQYQINILTRLLDNYIRFIYRLHRREDLLLYYLRFHILPVTYRIYSLSTSASMELRLLI